MENVSNQYTQLELLKDTEGKQIKDIFNLPLNRTELLELLKDKQSLDSGKLTQREE